MNITFRLDASEEIGIGHLMRCLALSEELINRGHRCYFLSKIDNEDLVEKIEKRKTIFKKLNSTTSLKEDLKKLIEFSKEQEIDWVVTDHYGIDSEYIKKIKKNGFKILSVDDAAQIDYCSDIILNQNIGSEKLRYSKKINSELLLGPKYVLLREELLRKNKMTESKNVKKILLTFGGTDNDNFTLKILKLLDSAIENKEFLVIAGPLNKFYEDIKKYSEDRNNITIIKSPENLADVYSKTDIAISAGGSSCYELAYFGIPNIIISIADNQLRIAEELEKQKVSIYSGKKDELNKEELIEKVKELIKNQTLRKKMSSNGKKLVDGKGKQRVVNFMEKM